MGFRECLLSKEKKKRGKLKPPSDVRREAVLCAIHSKLLKMSKLICTEELEVEFINSQLEVPYTIHQLVAVRDVFEDINVSQSGAIALPELLPFPPGYQGGPYRAPTGAAALAPPLPKG